MNRLISKVPFRIIAVITVAISLATTVSAASLKWNETEAHGTDPREMKFAQWVKAPQPVPAGQQADQPQGDALAAAAPEAPAQEEAPPVQQSSPAPAVHAQPLAASTPKAKADKPKQEESKSAPAMRAVPVKANVIVTPTGQTLTYKKAIPAVASAYTASAEENGGYAGRDYFGNPLQVGSIAVDPAVIPLGSKVFITGYSYDGLPAGGMVATATDIGGAIKGNRVDVFVPDSRQQAMKFGKQNVQIYILD
ncbi:3D domain-containing protein [Paenibacillus sp. SAFN-117]|uniref:3D domain-containing protein n=1 Tax=Paenibacillus sp. SAFN-117 TaxID=3436860 RepID=UPI003F7E08B8